MKRARSIAYALSAVAFVAATYLCIESLGGPKVIWERFGTRGIAVSVIAHWILNLTPLGEVVPMAVANGAIWGFWVGALVGWLGWMGASITQYLWVGLHLVNVTSAVRAVPFPRFLAFAALGQAGRALTMSALGAGLLSLL